MTRHWKRDEAIFDLIAQEKRRQETCINLIASENSVSPGVMEAQGSILTNKYAEGYPGRRYYGGCQWVDKIEQLAIDRGCELFGSCYANVQPHSGAQANLAVMMALLKPGDTLLGMGLSAGGHLSHGASFNVSGKWFKAVSYELDPQTHRIDIEGVRALAHRHRPSLIIVGGSSYPRNYPFKAFRDIADEVGAFLMADMAHVAGLVAAKIHPSPLPHAHVVTTTTHKTLGGARGGAIFTNDEEIIKRVNSAVFPGVQGGPLVHVIAGKAVSFFEALQPEFREEMERVVANAKALAHALQEKGFTVITGGTDTHMVLVDLRQRFTFSGLDAEKWLEEAGIICNKNVIPGDPLPPSQTSGIRLGTAAMTRKGFNEQTFQTVASLIDEVLSGSSHATIRANVRSRVEALLSFTETA